MLEVTRNEKEHRGHACYRTNKDGSTSVLCPYGHLIDVVPKGMWARSAWLLRSSYGHDIVTCSGRLKPDAEPYPFPDCALGGGAGK